MVILKMRWDLPIEARKDERRRTPEWQLHRQRLFLRYVQPCLVRQSWRDWTLWMLCDPELRGLSGRLQAALDPRCQLVYQVSSVRRRQYSLLDGGPHVFGRLDSDDLLSGDALTCFTQQSEPGLYQFGGGWAFDLETGNLHEWNHPSPPFIARVGTREMFANGLPSLGGDHGDVWKLATRIPGRHYCVLLHGQNVANDLRSRCCQGLVLDGERAAAVAHFGLEGDGPVV